MDFKTFNCVKKPDFMGVKTQYTHKFPNGWGVSIIQSPATYGGDKGLWELAVLNKIGQISYDTPITNDVLGYLTEEEVNNYCKQIAELPVESTPVLFVAFSHNLTQSQIDGFKSQYGVPTSFSDKEVEDLDMTEESELPYKMEAHIITLKEVNPELQNRISNISATATLVEIQEMAKEIVVEAVKAGATHFFMTGEATLTMWANLYAGGKASYDANCFPHSIVGYSFVKFYDKNELIILKPKMVCIQSTTERKSVETTQPDGSVVKTQVFSHVRWREMF